MSRGNWQPWISKMPAHRWRTLGGANASSRVGCGCNTIHKREELANWTAVSWTSAGNERIPSPEKAKNRTEPDGTRPSKIGAQPYKDITWKCHKPRMTKPEVFRGIEPEVQTYPAKDCSRMLDSKLKKWGRPKSPWIDCGGKKTHKGEKREDNPNRQKRKNYLTKQDRSPSGTIFFDMWLSRQ